MNYLQICQRAAVECGAASNSAITQVMPTTTVAALPSNLGRIVNWVNDAWTDVQMDSDEWEWMRSSNILGRGVAFRTVTGQVSYPLGLGGGDFSSDFSSDFTVAGAAVGVDVDAFGKWDRDTFRCFTTVTSSDFTSDFTSDFGGDFALFGNDEMFLDEIPYDRWRNGYMLGAMRRVRTRPYVIAVGPDQSLCLGPPPNGNYTITGDYWVAPSEMVDDGDIPVGLPTRFHMLIVYRTMCKYAGYESAPEVFERGSQEGAGMFAQLLAARAPRVSWSGALA